MKNLKNLKFKLETSDYQRLINTRKSCFEQLKLKLSNLNILEKAGKKHISKKWGVELELIN